MIHEIFAVGVVFETPRRTLASVLLLLQDLKEQQRTLECALLRILHADIVFAGCERAERVLAERTSRARKLRHA